jgi:hypothetical protein
MHIITKIVKYFQEALEVMVIDKEKRIDWGMRQLLREEMRNDSTINKCPGMGSSLTSLLPTQSSAYTIHDVHPNPIERCFMWDHCSVSWPSLQFLVWTQTVIDDRRLMAGWTARSGWTTPGWAG